MKLKELKGLPVYFYTNRPSAKGHIFQILTVQTNSNINLVHFFLRGLCVPEWLPIEARGPSESRLAPASSRASETTTCSEKTMGK